MKRKIDSRGRLVCVPEDGIELRVMEPLARLSVQVYWNESEGQFECLVKLWDAPAVKGDPAVGAGQTIRQALSNAYTDLLAVVVGKSVPGSEVDKAERRIERPIHQEAVRMAHWAGVDEQKRAKARRKAAGK